MKSFLVWCFAVASFVVGAEIKEVTGYGSGEDLKQALVAAKVDAILNAGGKTSVESEASHEQLVQDGGSSENEAHLISFEVTEKGESFDGTYVRIKASVSKDEAYTQKDGNAIIKGEGSASVPAEAAVLAMCDAVIASGAKIKAVVTYENDELVEDNATIDAHGFISSCVMFDGEKEGSVSAKCTILGSESDLNMRGSAAVSCEGTGDNVAFAEAVARREMVLNHGSYFSVHAEYDNGSQKTFSAERTRTGHLTGVMVTPGINGNGKATARVSGSLSDSSNRYATSNAYGIGYGKNVAAAHEAALCDAIINRDGCIKISISYDNGKETDCTTECAGNCYYIGENTLAPSRLADGFICETTVDTVSALPEVAADIAKTVEAVGFGTSRFAAVSDAKQRAVDMVFGSEVTVRMTERDGCVTLASCQASHSEKGYVDECDVISEDDATGTTIVTIKAVVKNHDGDAAGWGWITIAVVIAFLLMIFAGVREKLGVVAETIVWILSATCLFMSGHWAIGIVAILLGIGVAKEK